MRRIVALSVLLAAVVSAASAPAAHADGDPASDYLLVQKVFFPFDVKFPSKRKAELSAVVDEANRSGFKIRVAIIGGPYDMGSVTSLYGKPRTYARFLGEELSYVYDKRLLVVMPAGLGFNWPKHPVAPSYTVLRKVRVQTGGSGLLTTAQTAVQRLAAAAGVHVAVPAHVSGGGTSENRSRLIIIAATAALLLLAGLTRLALRRRQRVT
jgi:hypothetical protein